MNEKGRKCVVRLPLRFISHAIFLGNNGVLSCSRPKAFCGPYPTASRQRIKREENMCTYILGTGGTHG